jgi:hypothetical protein
MSSMIFLSASQKGKTHNPEIAVYGDAEMTIIDKLDDEKVNEIANGYNLKNSKKMEENKTRIIELDLRDVSEILFS